MSRSDRIIHGCSFGTSEGGDLLFDTQQETDFVEALKFSADLADGVALLASRLARGIDEAGRERVICSAELRVIALAAEAAASLNISIHRSMESARAKP